MRKTLLITASTLSILGIIFTILPLGTIAIIPNLLAIIMAFIVLKKSDAKQKTAPKIILLVSTLAFLTVIGKDIFVKDVVVVDKQFNLQKEESKQEAQKDLEGL
jgi:hypothetical protein